MIKKIEWNMKTRYSSNELYTVLTAEVLQELNFIDNGQCTFELFENMQYWVKNSICLFYNHTNETDLHDSFLVGYAGMRAGKYVAVEFRWIDSVE